MDNSHPSSEHRLKEIQDTVIEVGQQLRRPWAKRAAEAYESFSFNLQQTLGLLQAHVIEIQSLLGIKNGETYPPEPSEEELKETWIAEMLEILQKQTLEIRKRLQASSEGSQFT